MQLVINLQDHEGKSHKNVILTLDDQATIDQLRHELSSTFRIKTEYQQLFHNDELILLQYNTLEEAGIKHADTLILKHLHLDQWEIYVNEVNDFKKTQQINVKRSMAVTAQECYDILRTSSFFVTYREFESKASNLHPPIAKFLDKNTSSIINAATHFLMLKVFDGKNPVVKFEDVDLDEGSKAAVMCKVKIGSDVFRYRIKTNHNAGQSTQVSPWNLDLIELFCYKFLERIKVGPKILFVPNCVSSECILYIASEWIPTFRNFKGLNRSNVLQSESNRWRRALVQIYFLSVFLSLGSMHDENFGIDNNLNPIIVDFSVFNFDNPKEEFLNEYVICQADTMEIAVIIDLLDHEGTRHNGATLKFTHEATIEDLKKKINSLWQIDQDYQHLYYNGNEIRSLTSTLQQIGIKNEDVVVVKHALLPTWTNCLLSFDMLRKTRTEHIKSQRAKEGSQRLHALEDANFFRIYEEFYSKFLEISEQFDRYIIGSDECLKLSVERYFKKYFKNEGLNMDFINKSHTGAQGGLICRIMDGVNEQFFVKGHEFLTSRDSGDSRVDRRELFVYRLLHLIGVGPEPHFIPSGYSKCFTSKLALFIATKEVPGFQRHADHSTCNFTPIHEVQLGLLKHMFYLEDLNSGNYGLDGSQKLAVVDFGVSCSDDCIHRPAIFNKYSSGEWGDVCKEAWNKWNMLGKFNEAKDMILNDYSRLMGIHWREGYDDYLKTVLENINVLNKLLS